MEDITTDINLIIIRYLDGSATLEEKKILLQWLKLSAQNRNDFTETRDLWLSCNTVTNNIPDIDIALDRLRVRIVSEHDRIKHKQKYFSLKRWSQIAAVLLVLLGSSYWLTLLTNRLHPEIIVQNQLITAKGSKGKFTLPDGTIVWLNSESRLVYPEKFNEGKRQVCLSGGGYFEVVKDTERPFVVEVGDIDVEVLGTSFNISGYPSSPFMETALLNGSVKISGKAIGHEILLEPDQVFEYQKENNHISVKPARASLYADWIKDRLIFDNTPLSDIIISMEGWYNIKIDCPDEFAKKTFMSFTIRQETLDEILKAMSFIAPVNHQIKEGKAYIIPK